MNNKYLCFFFCALLPLLSSCGSKSAKEAPSTPPVPVIAAPSVVKDLTVYLDSVGTLRPAISVEIYPQVNGQLIKVLAKEGEWIKKNAPLFEIDPAIYAIKVREMEAQAAMDRADSLAVQMKLERFKELAKKDLIAQTEWDDLTAQAQKLQAAMELNQARLSAAALDLSRCSIISPVEGRIGKLDVHPGTLVSPAQSVPLVTVMPLDPLLIEFTVTEKEFPLVSGKQAAIEIRTLCGSNLSAQGQVTFFDHHFDTHTGLLLVRGIIANPEHQLLPGQTMKVRVPVSVTSNAQLIPQKAIRYNQEGPYVYVVQADQTVALRPVILGNEHDKHLLVLGGLDPEELVVIDGHLRLYPGVKVDVKL